MGGNYRDQSNEDNLYYDDVRLLLPGSDAWEAMVSDGLSAPLGQTRSVRMGDYLWCLGGTDGVGGGGGVRRGPVP